MSDDLFADSVQQGWGNNQLTSDLLNEGDLGMEGDEQAATQEREPVLPQQQQQVQQQAPATQQAQQPRRFVPEDYQAPSSLRSKRDNLVVRYKALNAKLAKARNRETGKNPYAYVDENNNVQIDSIAYNDDMRELNAIKMEIDEVNERLRESQETTQRGLQGVRQYARDFFLRNEQHLDKDLRASARAAFSRYFNDLVTGGHFENPRMLEANALEQALSNLLKAAIGDAVMTARTQQRGKPKPQGTVEDDVEPEGSEDDEFADWPEESRKMFAAFERHSSVHSGTLADRAKQKGNQ